jgi:hypothetical protein
MGPPGPRVVALVPDLIAASRIESAVTAVGGEITRIDDPASLPAVGGVDLLVVDWGARRPDWGTALSRWRGGSSASNRPRVLLFGPHTDLEAHADARVAGLAPMRARSAFFSDLASIFRRR